MVDLTALNIYIDGSCYPSPRRGGIGVRFKFPLSLIDEITNKNDIKDFKFRGQKGMDNQKAELQACITALDKVLESKEPELKRIPMIIIHTDSMYVVDCYKKAMFEWPNAQWKRRCGSPVLNAELWKKLRNNIKKVESRVNIKYVRGHSEDKDNRAVDVMAKLSANNPQKKNENRANVRRKYFGKKGQQGSVRMCGQRISIWINFSEYLSTQKVWRYKYEVISPKSKFYKRSGSIFYNKYLRLGHGYLVSFNKNDDDPRIVNDFKEIKKIIYKNYQPDSTNN